MSLFETLRAALRVGWRAARMNVRAILLIQAIAAAIVIAYYKWPWFAQATRAVEPWRAKWGLPLSFALGFLAGGVVPELAKLATRQTARLDGAVLHQVGFLGLVYGILGVQIDLFYRLQAMLFGTNVDVSTIVRKLAVDMGLGAPLLFIPYTVGMFLWRERGFKIAAIPTLFTLQTYRERVLNIQVMNWVVWIPVLCAVYSLPVPLQFPLSTLIEACWCLLVVVMAEPSEP